MFAINKSRNILDRSMKKVLTELPLPKASLKLFSIFNKEYCELWWFLQNPVSSFDRKSSLYSLI